MCDALQLWSGIALVSGVGGALMFEFWSSEMLPSSEGGACTAGTKRGSINNAEEETGILDGGVGGTGELFGGALMVGHKFDAVGMVMLGYRFRLFVE
jgi:hypothetical protein